MGCIALKVYKKPICFGNDSGGSHKIMKLTDSFPSVVAINWLVCLLLSFQQPVKKF